MLDGTKSDGVVDGNEVGSRSVGRALELLLGSHVTIALLASFVLNLFVLVILCLKVFILVLKELVFEMTWAASMYLCLS